MNSTPARSSAARIFLAVSSRPPSGPSCASNRFIVGMEMSAAAANCSWDQANSDRAALSCLIDTFGIDFCETIYDTFSINQAAHRGPEMSEALSRIQLTALQYQVIRERLMALDRDLDEQALADTLEGLTDLHEILAAIVREALTDEALAVGLRHRMGAMEQRLDHLLFRAAKRREIAREVMTETDLKKVTAPDLTLVLRPGSPALTVTDERAIPAEFWVAREPRLNRQELLAQLKAGAEIQGVQLSNPQPVLTVRTK